jgi:hypothetical protein
MRTQLARKAVVHSRNRLSAPHCVPNQTVDLLDRLNLCPYNTHLPNLTCPLTACALFSTIYNTVVLGAELQLLHVARTSAESSSSQRRPVQRFIGRGSFIAYDTHAVVLGKPAERIVRYADEIDADLIIMPSRRYGTLRQLIFGSTTMDVVRLTTRSVWIVTRQSLRRGATLTCRRIVCGIDLSSEGQPVMKYADTLAVGCAADLVFVHAVPGLSDAVLAAYGLGEPEDVAVLPTAAHQ